ncbi:uncharacterized protein KZ484_017796 [Pholidichthys leucotaenia]
MDTTCIAEQLSATFNLDAEQVAIEIVTLQNDLLLKAYQAAPNFWCLVDTEKYNGVCTAAMKVTSLFGSTYLCESAFSDMNFIKNKHRTRLTDAHLQDSLRVTESSYTPDYDTLIAEVIDDRPEDVKQMEAFRTSNRWKVIGVDEGGDTEEGDAGDQQQKKPAASSRNCHESPELSSKKRKLDAPGRKTQDDFPDISPPRRNHHDSPDVSLPRKSHHDSPDISPLKRGHHDSPDLSPPCQHSGKPRKVDSQDEFRNAKTVFRDKSGQRRDMFSEREEQKKKAGEKAAKDEKYTQWGKGLAQSQLQQENLEDTVVEAQKLLARHYDDEDLDRMLREQEREGDPMAAMLWQKKSHSIKTQERPHYKGPAPPPNRFSIQPGYRWDGVDRSHSFKQKRYMQIADKKAMQEASYKWSVEDM